MKEKKALNIQIGNEIRKAREQAELTQEKLAEMIQLDSKNLSDIERGVVGISISTLTRICRALSVSSDVILFGKYAENDADYLTDKIRRLPPDKFIVIKELINKFFEAMSRLDNL